MSSVWARAANDVGRDCFLSPSLVRYRAARKAWWARLSCNSLSEHPQFVKNATAIKQIWLRHGATEFLLAHVLVPNRQP
jgi:hypothetical protein